MKYILILLAFLSATFTLPAQNMIDFEKTGRSYSEKLIEIKSSIQLKFLVKETYAKEFTTDPMKFLRSNFDMKAYLQDSNKIEYPPYKVSFKSNKTHVLAEYDKHGELLYTFRSIKNKTMPYFVQKEIVENFKDWRVIKNIYIASGKKDRIDEEFYSITINKRNEFKIIRIIPDPISKRAIVTID